MIDPNFWSSEDVAKLNIFERLLLVGLFSNADDHGKGRAHSAYILSTIFPYDDFSVDEIEAAMCNIQNVINITIYEVDGNQYYKFNNWKKWQTVQKPQPSIIPDPVENNSGMSQEQVQNNSRLKEKKRKEENLNSYCYSETPPDKPVDNVDNINNMIEPEPTDAKPNTLDEDIKRVAHEFTSCGYGTINSVSAEILDELIRDYSVEWVCNALRVGLEQGKRSLSYVRGILENWKREGGIYIDKNKNTAARDRPKNKNKFHNFDQPMMNYTKEQLDAILFKRKSADRGG